MKANKENLNKGIRNRSLEYFSEQAEARGLVILDAEEYKKMIERKDQLEEAVQKFQTIIGSK